MYKYLIELSDKVNLMTKIVYLRAESDEHAKVLAENKYPDFDVIDIRLTR